MLIPVDGRVSDQFLQMATQTNPVEEQIQAQILHKVKAWAPKRAKSYTVFNCRDEDYYGHAHPHITGYRGFRVSYYSRKNEGENNL
jgi:hypothetical protein